MKPLPPSDLSAPAKKLYLSIAAEIEIDAGAEPMLAIVCQQWDRMRQARGILRRQGLTVKDRFGKVKLHPAHAIERDAICAMTRAWRALGLDLAPPKG